MPGNFIGIKLYRITKATMMNQKLDFMHKGHIDIYKTNESKLMKLISQNFITGTVVNLFLRWDLYQIHFL
jgi:hypothetical protein